MHYRDSYNLASELPFERHSVGPSGPVVLRYKTARARRTHLDVERQVLAERDLETGPAKL